jgi:hypothetical protein
MATEVITRTLCDVHLQKHDNDSVEGLPATVVINGETFVIDVCPECSVPIQSVLEYVREFGRSPDAKQKPIKRGATTEQCPAGGCTFTGTKAQLRAHARQKHAATLIDLRGETTPYVCPHDGQHFEGNQGLSVHITRTHGGVWEPAPGSDSEGSPKGRGKGGKAA